MASYGVLVWIVGCGWLQKYRGHIIVHGAQFIGKEKGKQKAEVEKRKDEGEDEARQQPRGNLVAKVM